MSRQQFVEAVAKLLAGFELYDWATLPDVDFQAVRDRGVYRDQAGQIYDATHGSGH